MPKVSGLKEHCTGCLRTERYSGSVILTIIDVAFTSIVLNYFTTIVPKVKVPSSSYLTFHKKASLPTSTLHT